ncbi:MAG: hypothetical protein FJX67_08650 [Alphaproteobacteria bacterium]|nr:hypothetical protein [Alphaproteobacteria bacterium]
MPLRTPPGAAMDRTTFYVWPASFGTGPIAHFIAFVIAAFLLVLDRPGAVARTTGHLVVFAFTTEALQSFYYSREAELEDLLMNAGGIVTGAVLALALRMVRDRVRAHRVAARLTMN